ncbi:PREDICTED: uncharacterized protein LOC106308851 [Brassica oleracea var. oleracea]|uniref:uncharacterized protein LOC106308851 n=1 Tax=Brassica oleracea var. oleracea TaxID=109376 RepID=UPI0006A6AF0C|nr:PREDICTED: uncharacterized protein LOC106308851 [Brassica oleracea var. oleracea]
MTEKENPWFSPDRPSALIPPPTTAGSPLLRPPDPPFASQFSSLQQTLASPPLSKKQIFRALGTASLAQVESSASTFSASLAQDPVPITDRVPVIRSDLTLSASAVTTKDQFKGFIVHIPKKSLPFPSNSASSSRKHPGIPQVTIPDEVFQRGAEMHRDFIQGHFFAKMPSYQAIQSVLNFMWGKGAKLDIRTNLKDRSILVRIPNEYIRSKVLEKRIWYVGTSMFHVSQWCSSNSAPASLSIPTSIPLWAHLKGLPLDLRSLEGLTFAAGLIGKPKETDEFTRNLADLDLAHVKIEAVFSKPLPELIELRRTTGEIIPVEVSYPWVPPSCSNCQELGHIMKDCLHANPTWVEKDKTASKVPEAAKNSTNINAVAVNTDTETNIEARPGRSVRVKVGTSD